MRVWADDIKSLSAVLSLEYFTQPPELPSKLTNINQVRFIYRSIANTSGAGLISADVVSVNKIDCIETIFKMLQPSRGMVYVGSLTIPFADFSYVVKVQAIEVGSSKREAVVLARLLGTSVKFNHETSTVEGWEQDPYLPDEEFPLMPNRAEAVEYDDEFPEHSLSKVRRALHLVKATIQFDEEIQAAQRYDMEA